MSQTSPLSPYPPAFRRLAWSNLVAQLAEQVALAAAPLVAVLAFGAGTGATGLLQAAQTLPFLLLSIPAGMLADRATSRPRLLAAAETLRAASLALVLVLIGLGLLNLWLLAFLGFVGAAGTVAYSVATPALVPSLVPREALSPANGRIELARTTAFAAGPALGGALVGWIGASLAFGAAACMSLLAVVLLSGVRELARPKLPRRRPLAEVREGAAFVFHHPLLRPVFGTQVVFNLAFFVLQAAYVPYAVRHLGLGAVGVGLTLAAYGAGLVAGALVAARVVASLPFGAAVGIGPVSGLAASLLMTLTIPLPWPLLAAMAFFVMGAGPVVWVVSTTALRQTVTPAGLLGRVSALNILAYGARPVGAALGALVGEAYGGSVLASGGAGLHCSDSHNFWLAGAAPCAPSGSSGVNCIKSYFGAVHRGASIDLDAVCRAIMANRRCRPGPDAGLRGRRAAFQARAESTGVANAAASSRTHSLGNDLAAQIRPPVVGTGISSAPLLRCLAREQFPKDRAWFSPTGDAAVLDFDLSIILRSVLTRSR